MRGLFGLAGLLIALALVGVLVKKQLAATQQPVPVLAPPAAQDAASPGAVAPVREQGQQIQQQYRQAIEGAMQSARTVADEK